MHHTLKLLFFFLLFSCAMHAQEYFTITYGGTYLEQLTKMRPTADGGYVMVGSTDSYGPNAGSLGSNYYIVKTDAAGQQQWATAVGGSQNDFPYDVRQLSDGGFAVIGYTASFGSVLSAMLVKFDASGTVVWTKKYSASTNVNGYCLFEKANGNLILAGTQEVPVSTAQANWISETDPQGNLIHNYTYQSSFGDRVSDIDTTHDGNILMCGYTQNPFSDDIFIFKFDTALNVIWYVRENTSGAHSNRAQAIQELWNGNILIAGGSSLHESNQYISDVMMYMFDSTGNAMGGYLYGQSSIYEMAYDLWVDPITKKFYASGELNDQVDVGITIVGDSNMTMVDIVNPGFGKLAYYERNISITRNANRSFALAGHTLETGGGDFFLALRDTALAAPQSCHGMSLGPYNQWNAPLLFSSPQPYASTNAVISASSITPQIGSGGVFNVLCSTVGVDELSSSSVFSIYPNPSSGKFTIEVAEAGECRVVDVMGRVVRMLRLEVGRNEVELSGGVYWVSGGVRGGKMVVVE